MPASPTQPGIGGPASASLQGRNPREVGLSGAAPYGDLGRTDRLGEPIFRFVMEWCPPLDASLGVLTGVASGWPP